MKYKYFASINSLKYDLQSVVYYLDRSMYCTKDGEEDFFFNQALVKLGDIIKQLQVFIQDQSEGKEI